MHNLNVLLLPLQCHTETQQFVINISAPPKGFPW